MKEIIGVSSRVAGSSASTAGLNAREKRSIAGSARSAAPISDGRLVQQLHGRARQPDQAVQGRA